MLKSTVVKGSISIESRSITSISADVIVNAANSQLEQGGGVCGAIFNGAGPANMRMSCKSIGHCETGKAVLTPAWDLKNCRYVIHAVGPVWQDGNHGEPELLYQAYKSALELARQNECSSIVFPLISTGSCGYPLRDAMETAMRACVEFLTYRDFTIKFAIPRKDIAAEAHRVLEEVMEDKNIYFASEPWKEPYPALDRAAAKFMQETLLALKMMYADQEIRDRLLVIYRTRTTSAHDAAIDLLVNRFNELEHMDMMISFGHNLLDHIDIPMTYEETRKTAAQLSRLQLLAMFTCMIGHVLSEFRITETSIFCSWMLREGVLIPVFEKYLGLESSAQTLTPSDCADVK